MQATTVRSLQCSTIWLPNCTTKRLQHIQNATACLIKLTRKHDHVSPIPFNLHWLPVNYHMMFMIFFGIIIHAQYAYTLHSYNYIYYPTIFFFTPLCYLKAYRARSFSMVAPRERQQMEKGRERREHREDKGHSKRERKGQG